MSTVAVVDAQLSPVQQRNLEREWGCKVIDRTGLILDIFGERAATREGIAAGGVGASGVSAEPAGAILDPPRAAAWRVRVSRRAGRDADRGGPAVDWRSYRAAEARAGAGAAHPRAASDGAAAECRIPIIGAGGLHQCGQVDAVQCADRGRTSSRSDQLFATLDPTMRGLRLPVRTAGSSCPIRWGSSAICRPSWWRRSAPRSRRWRKRT